MESPSDPRVLAVDPLGPRVDFRGKGEEADAPVKHAKSWIVSWMAVNPRHGTRGRGP
jgi:hypothetical protein